MNRPLKKAMSRLHGARKALGTALAWLGLCAALAAPSSAASQGGVNLNINVQGVAMVTDLTAVNSAVGEISLTWTEPQRNGATPAFSYDIHASTVGQISNNADFAAARPLIDFSSSTVPPVGAAGGQTGFVVTGLAVGKFYTFAIRMQDSAGTPHIGAWVRNPGAGFNTNNSASSGFVLPQAITDLTALAGNSEGGIRLAWTAPQGLFTSAGPYSYTIRFATFSAAALAGDTTAWYDALTSSSVTLVPTQPEGGLETYGFSGFGPATQVFFAVKSANLSGGSPIDGKAGLGNLAEARARGIGAVTDLVAAPGVLPRSVDLTWTDPFISSPTAPAVMRVKVSASGNIADDAAFAAAQDLGAFSSTPAPGTGAGGGARVLTVTGLDPGTTYYFALRGEDSGAPQLKGVWLRDAASGRNASNFAQVKFIAIGPDQITDLTALEGAQEGEVNLSWTAPPGPNLSQPVGYALHLATFSAASLGGDATAWFNIAPVSMSIPAAKTAGGLESLLLTGLEPNTTVYLGIRTSDGYGLLSGVDLRATSGNQAGRKPKNLPPGTPSGFSALGGLRKSDVSWNGLPDGHGGKGLDFDYYRLYRSTKPAADFVVITTLTATAFTDKPLKALTTYYYKASGVDRAGLESVLTSTASAFVFTYGPMEPMGVKVTVTSTAFNVDWEPTTRFAEGTLFESTGTTFNEDELIGYAMFRATIPCSHDPTEFALLANIPPSVTTFTDTTADAYYYQIKSYNSLGYSPAVMVLAPDGARNFFADDCASKMVMSNEMAEFMNESAKALGGAMTMQRRVRTEDLGGDVMQSVEFKPMMNGEVEMKNWHLPSPAKVVLRFGVKDGKPSPNGLGPRERGLGVLDEQSTANLGMYWNNGEEFKKLYGTVDPVNQTVTVETPNPGQFQIRTLLRANGPVFDLSNISARAFTPNGDGLNDLVIFTYDPGPRNPRVEGRIMDLSGRFVAEMKPGLVPNTLTWDGAMNGKTVTSGVYMYQVKAEDKTFSGTIVVAR